MRISDWSSDVCSSDLSSYWRPPCDRAHARHGRAPDVRRSPLLLRHATREHLDAFQRDEPDMVEIVETLLDEIAQLALAIDDFDHDRQIVTAAERMVVVDRRRLAADADPQIGRAACRERVCTYV